MLKILIILNLLFGNGDDISKIAKANAAKNDAEKAFLDKDYTTSIQKYHYLLDSLGYKDENAALNLAHAYFLIEDTANSIDLYKSVYANSLDRKIKSIAQQQLGNILAKQQKLEESLKNYKQAIRENPQNMGARYDYELVKKLLEKQKEEEQKDDKKKDDKKKEDKKKEDKKKEDNKKKEDKKKDDEKKDDEKKDGEKKDGEDKKDSKGEDGEKKEKKDEKKEEGAPEEKDKKDEKGEPKPSEKTQEQKDAEEKKKQQQMQQRRFNDLKISPKKAQMILDAMKNQEKQYFQQLKKKPTQRKDNSKPDW